MTDDADATERTYATGLKDAIDTAIEDAQENWDSLGISISLSGSECRRALWYALRWVLPPEVFKAQTLRIFETGNIYEERMIAWFRMACKDVWDVDEKGKQYAARMVGGWVRGKSDIVVRGVPDMPPDEVFVVEVKSHNKSSYNRVLKYGVRKAKYEHWVQLEAYLRYFNIQRGIYAFACKDDDRIEFEVIERDDEALNVLLGNLEATVKSNFAPPRISDDPEFFACKFCRFSALCHGQATPQRRTCRSCVHSSPIMGCKYPSFDCARHGLALGTDDQKQGCDNHLFLPELIPGEQIDVSEADETITYRLPDGEQWVDRSSNMPPLMEGQEIDPK